MSLKMAILGQLIDSPKSGYEIKSAFRDTVRNFWHVSDGQLYPTLRKLSDQGMVKKQELLGTNGLKKHEYTITTEGRSAFRSWLTDTKDVPIPEMKEPFLLKLMYFENLSKDEQLVHIDAQIEQTAYLIEDYRENWREQVSTTDNPYLRLVADAGLVLLEARKMYLEQLRKGVQNGNVQSRIPLFDDETMELGKELALQMLDMFQAGGSQLSIQDLLGFVKK